MLQTLQSKKLKLQKIQFGILAFGTVFAYINIVIDFVRFYKIEGTIFKFKDCLYTNPFLTPCFWGGLAFLICTVMAYKILKGNNALQRPLNFLVLFGVIFAWGNFAHTLYNYIVATRTGTEFISCSGQPASNPILTPCLGGAVLYTLSYFAVNAVNNLNNSENKNFEENTTGPSEN